MAVVGLIPARGGSKGVPGKNIKPLGGKPLICWTIEAALGSSLLDRVIVSTDSEEIAAIAAEAGAEVPFLRPSSLAEDRTPDGPVMTHMLDMLRHKEDLQVSTLVYLRPTTPFKTSGIIDQCIAELEANDRYSSLRTITRVEGVHHPYWMHRLADGILTSFIKDLDASRYVRRQVLPPCYRVNGVVDVLRPEVIADDPMLYGDCIGTVELDEAVSLDIDTILDFAFCEFVSQNPSLLQERS